MNYFHCIKDYFFGEQKLYKFKSVDIVGSPQTLVDAKKYFQIYFGKQEQLLKYKDIASCKSFNIFSIVLLDGSNTRLSINRKGTPISDFIDVYKRKFKKLPFILIINHGDSYYENKLLIEENLESDLKLSNEFYDFLNEKKIISIYNWFNPLQLKTIKEFIENSKECLKKDSINL